MTNPDLVRWLNLATRGLPADVAASVRAEFEAHYEDALLEHQSRGLSDFDAHRQALAELGDARGVARALHDAHLAERRYLKAAILSIAPSVLFLLVLIVPFNVEHLSANSTVSLDFTAFLGPLTLACVAYVLRSFKLLLSLHCDVDLPIKIISRSLLIIAVVTLISQASFRYQVAILFNDPMLILNRGLFNMDSVLESVSAFINVTGILVLGFGWILLSDRLAGVADQLYGLIKPLRYVLLLNGFSVASSGLAALVDSHNASVLAVTAVVVIGTIKCALWTLLFFRAAYRGSNPPLQTI